MAKAQDIDGVTSRKTTQTGDDLVAALEELRPLLTRHFCRMRDFARTQAGLQGLGVSERDVEDLLAQPIGTSTADQAREDNSLPERTLSGKFASRERPSHQPESPLDRLTRLFGLTTFDIGVLLISVAIDLDLRFGLLFAYLQDDVTRKQPSVDLLLTLLCDSFGDRLEQRQRFLPSAPLLHWDLLRLHEDSNSARSLLAMHCHVDARIVEFLLGSSEIDDRLHPVARLRSRADRQEHPASPVESRSLIQLARGKRQRLLVHFEGPRGVGKSAAARATAFELGMSLLEVEVERLTTLELPAFAKTVRLIFREAMLQDATIYWKRFDALLPDEKAGWLRAFRNEMETHPGLNILGGESRWEPSNLPADSGFRRIEFKRPSLDERLQVWENTLPPGGRGAGVDLNAVAQSFRLSGGQIRDAAKLARELAAARDSDDGSVTTVDIYEACRAQSSRKLAALARKITPRRVWTDIVLPEDRLLHLREVANAMKYRALIYDQWGFEQKLSLGKGLNVLFAGPSGTGKTLAAEIMAGEMGLELYKIDLSSIVSKYIGETEKNLSHIFDEAENCNAILFFDEADALFGKRTEVRDSHDRYANIEVNYLLQKIEEYDGVVILATNFRRNMDEAFVRRMHFTVEFPFPEEADRLRIWEKVWPHATPRQELDLELMARKFELSGAGIRNIALSAAFLAANNGGKVGMRHLLHGARREYQKMGKVVADSDFEMQGRTGEAR